VPFQAFEKRVVTRVVQLSVAATKIYIKRETYKKRGGSNQTLSMRELKQGKPILFLVRLSYTG
jgi:hypothetical protein